MSTLASHTLNRRLSDTLFMSSPLRRNPHIVRRIGRRAFEIVNGLTHIYATRISLQKSVAEFLSSALMQFVGLCITVHIFVAPTHLHIMHEKMACNDRSAYLREGAAAGSGPDSARASKSYILPTFQQHHSCN